MTKRIPVAALAAALSIAGTAHAHELTLTASPGSGPGAITGHNQGFSVESADFAHGYLTKRRMSQWLRTLGPHGVIRLGGYSMDLVWPAFGRWAGTPAPDWAIGGTVDASDLRELDGLVDHSGWQVTLGAPLKSVLEGDVALDQFVAEVAAVRAAIGDDLQAVELGNEYDHVTTLTAAGYYAEMKRYRDAIAAAVPGVPVKMTGPSANTASTNTKLDDFVTAVLADPAPQPQSMFSELASHWYPGSHCGSSTTSIPSLMSDRTVLRTRAKLDGIMAIGARLEPAVPMVINESNSASCSGQAGVSDSYATALWGLDYLMQTAQSGVSRLSFHTSTAALCGRLEARDSPLYPISYRFYAAFCAPDPAALDADELEAAPLYYGIWAFRQVPPGRFLDLDLPDAELPRIRAYAVQDDTGDVTAVLVNVQDPAAAESTDEVVTLDLPGAYRKASSVVLESSSPGGLASTARDGITLGRRDLTSKGVPRGGSKRVAIESDTVTVAPGTAQIVTFEG